jgi:hypothetical protein
MSQKFHQRFNIEVSLEEATRRFVNRAHDFVIHNILPTLAQIYGYQEHVEVEKYICRKLGDRYTGVDCLSPIIGDNYHVHIRMLEALYQWPRAKELVDRAVMEILADSEVDLGIRWNNGHFLPSGSPLLDEKLVNDVLGTLGVKGHDGVLVPFKKGLDHFLHSVKKPELLADVITDMYEALEALAKIITGRDKDLSANAELLISKLNVSEEYKPILKAYIGYANEFRHAAEMGQKKAIPSPQEVESFIYLTGLFVRLAMT